MGRKLRGIHSFLILATSSKAVRSQGDYMINYASKYIYHNHSLANLEIKHAMAREKLYNNPLNAFTFLIPILTTLI